MTEPWPLRFAPLSVTDPWIDNGSRSGGVTLSGSEQNVSSPAGRLAISATFRVRDAEDRREWRRMLSILNRREPVLFPLFDCGGQPGELLITYFEEADGAETGFTDGTAFVEETATASLADDAPLNSTVISVSSDVEPKRGHLIGFQGDRGHIVEAVEPVSAGLYTLTIAPWTRVAYPALEPISFRLIRCAMKLRNTAQLDLEILRFGRPTLDLVEHF